MLKKKNFIYIAVILSGLLTVFSCGQDPIFYKISQETPQEEAFIKGAPTNMVECKRGGTDTVMYVASGEKLHWYRNGTWDSGAYYTPNPGGMIISLAATSTYLYAVCNTGMKDTKLRRIELAVIPSYWEDVQISLGSYPYIQRIYADGSAWLFAAARNDTDFGILFFNGSDWKLIESNTQMLSGAAFDGTDYYLSTQGTGVYQFSGSNITEHFGNGNFTGMITIGSKIIVVEEDGGTLYEVTSSGLNSLRVSTGKYATGALALWTKGTDKMLTAGIQGAKTNTVTSHGYVEFYLDSTGLPYGSPNNPPTITTGGNPDRYQGSLGKHPINHMHQASVDVDSSRRFFASTQSAGLWSYKYRSGGDQWNAEN